MAEGSEKHGSTERHKSRDAHAFDNSGDIDFDLFQQLIEKFIEDGVHG